MKRFFTHFISTSPGSEVEAGEPAKAKPEDRPHEAPAGPAPAQGAGPQLDDIALGVLAASPLGVLVLDPDFDIRFSNPAVTRLCGWTEGELLGQPLSLLLGDAQQHRLLSHVRQAGGSGADVRLGRELDLTLRRKNGGERRVKVSVSVLGGQGEPRLSLNLRSPAIDDIELRLAREQALEFRDASENKSRFLAHVSHEIRTPLNGILGMIDLIANSSLDPTQRVHLASLKSSSRNLRALLNDILDISKIEAGLIELDQVPFDAVEKVKAVVDAFYPTARAKGVALKFQSNLRHRLFLGDPHRLSQVVSNLIDNALKFTERGSVVVRLSGQPPTAPTGHEATGAPMNETGLPDHPQRWSLLLSVADTGRGIAPERQARLFDPFYQAGPEISRNYGGSGLGLYLCKQLVDLMHGRVKVVSQPGQGSVFEFTMSLEATCREAVFLETLPPVGLERLRGTRVMVVDDDLTGQALAEAWLKDEGVGVVLRSNGLEAVDYLLTGDKLDAVLMDVSMPVMDGIEATIRIRREAVAGHPRGKYLAEIPILGISGHAFDEEKNSSLIAGMTDYLVKPLSRSRLLEKLRTILPDER